MEGENLKLALREVGKLIRKNLKQKFKEKDFYASGDLDKSFKYRVKDNELYIFGEQYANALSDGIKNKSNSVEYTYKTEVLKECGPFLDKELIGDYSVKIKIILDSP